jgi:hypothetical protein
MAARKGSPTATPSDRAASALRPLAGRQLRLALPALGAMNPGLAWISNVPEQQATADGDPLEVLGTNMAGLWFVLHDDGSVHLVDDCERELGTVIFATIDAFAEELRRQNGA